MYVRSGGGWHTGGGAINPVTECALGVYLSSRWSSTHAPHGDGDKKKLSEYFQVFQKGAVWLQLPWWMELQIVAS